MNKKLALVVILMITFGTAAITTTTTIQQQVDAVNSERDFQGGTQTSKMIFMLHGGPIKRGMMR